MEPSNLFFVKPIQSDFCVHFEDAHIVAKFVNKDEYIVLRAAHVAQDLLSLLTILDNRDEILLQNFNRDLCKATVEFYGHQEDAEYYKVASARNLVKILRTNREKASVYKLVNVHRWCYIEREQEYREHLQPDRLLEWQEYHAVSSVSCQDIESKSKNNTTRKCQIELDRIYCPSKRAVYEDFQKKLASCRADNDWVSKIKEMEFAGFTSNCRKDIIRHLTEGPGDVSGFMRYLARRIYGKKKLSKTLMGRNGEASRAIVRDGERNCVFSVEEENKLFRILSTIDKNMFESDNVWTLLVKLPINQAGRDALKSLKK